MNTTRSTARRTFPTDQPRMFAEIAKVCRITMRISTLARSSFSLMMSMLLEMSDLRIRPALPAGGVIPRITCRPSRITFFPELQVLVIHNEYIWFRDALHRRTKQEIPMGKTTSEGRNANVHTVRPC